MPVPSMSIGRKSAGHWDAAHRNVSANLKRNRRKSRQPQSRRAIRPRRRQNRGNLIENLLRVFAAGMSARYEGRDRLFGQPEQMESGGEPFEDFQNAGDDRAAERTAGAVGVEHTARFGDDVFKLPATHRKLERGIVIVEAIRQRFPRSLAFLEKMRPQLRRRSANRWRSGRRTTCGRPLRSNTATAYQRMHSSVAFSPLPRKTRFSLLHAYLRSLRVSPND